MQKHWRDLFWILPASLAGGLALSLLGPGTWWKGWLACSLVILLGIAALAALWRSSGSSRALGWMLVLAVVLRLGLGMAFTYILPAYGNDTPVQNAGYIFSDAYNRDTQAWELADSPTSLLTAFQKSSASSDQYGGLLFLSSLLYRFLSPDAHRPWLVILAGALVAGMGVVLAYKATRKAWGERIASLTGWTVALFPEAILLGSSQMREPFIMTFIAMLFWGLVTWADHRRNSGLWMAGGLAGLLLFHPGVAVAAVVILAIWAWLRARERRIPLWVWAGTAVIVLGGMVLFGLAIGSSTSAEGGFVGRIINWVRYTIRWDSLVVFDNSGWIQAIFSRVPKVFHLPLLIGYGMLQPVLPAAIGDIQGVWPMQAVGILRGLGWFVLLPFLVYAPFSLRRIEDKRERLAWLWLWAAMALWIIISSARGGGDQWDNPRYRATLLLFQAALAAQVFRIEMASHARGLIRLIEVEAVFVLCFSIWTYSRYNGDTAYLPLGGTFLTFLGLSLLILIGDWLWFRSKKLKSPDRIAS